MRKSMTVLMALAVLAAGGAAAWALDTNTLTVTASVTGTCMFQSETSALGFGALDPSNPANANGSTTTQFWCTRGVPTATIVAGNGANYSGTSRQMLGPAGDVIPYSLSLAQDALTNEGPAFPRTLTISGTVLAADYTGKSAGNYSDTVTLTLTP